VLPFPPNTNLTLAAAGVTGPGAMTHASRIGPGSVIEPAAIVCDWTSVGAESVVRAGACVKQRDRFADRSVLDGFPAKLVDILTAPPPRPGWALPPDTPTTLHRIDR